jgi:hypothetical protein
MTKLDLEKLTELSEHFAKRKARAKERLAMAPQCDGWYFGIIGLPPQQEKYVFIEPGLQLVPVVEPPGEVELAQALVNPGLFGVIARYSHSITHELQVFSNSMDGKTSFQIAWWLIALIRIRTISELLVPVAANYSWSVISAVEPKTCSASLLEDFPHSKRLTLPASLANSDLDWIKTNLYRFIDLLGVPSFRLAVDALCTYHHQESSRMMVAMLWSGIEALFSVQSELRFRLAVYIAVLVAPRGKERKAVYQKVKKLYDVRSKAVHGSKLKSEQIDQHLLEVRELLSRMLCRLVEAGKVLSEDELEDDLFSSENKAESVE